MKIYSKEHQKAMELKHKMDDIDKKHKKLVERWVKEAKTPKYRADKKIEERYIKLDKSYTEKSDKAYKNYYDHMHKCLDLKPASIHPTKKYPQGFDDDKWVTDMFKAKAAKEKSNVKQKSK